MTSPNVNESKPIVTYGAFHTADKDYPTFLAAKAITNTLIMSFLERKLFMVELKDGKETYDAEPVIDNVDCFCLSKDKRWLAVLNDTEIRLWDLHEVEDIADFKKITPKTFKVDTGIPEGEFPREECMQFIGDDSHVVFWHPLKDNAVVIINVNNGNVTDQQLKDADPKLAEVGCIFPISTSKLIIVIPEKVVIYDFILKDGQLILSNPVNPPSPPIKRGPAQHFAAAASLDGRFIAATLSHPERHGDQHSGTAIENLCFVQCWEILPDNQFKFLKKFISPTGFEPYFTCNNTLVFNRSWPENFEISTFECGSMNPDSEKHVSIVSMCSFDLPNGDIMALDEEGHFLYQVVPLQRIYHNALSTLVYALEVGEAVKQFSGSVSEVVGGYVGLYSKPLKPGAASSQFAKGLLGDMIDRLITDSHVGETDKSVLRDLKEAVKKSDIPEAVKQVINTPAMSIELRWLVTQLRERFSPRAEMKAGSSRSL